MREDVDGLALDSASHSDIGNGNATVPNRIGGHSSVGGISQASAATMHRPGPFDHVTPTDGAGAARPSVRGG